MQELERHTRLLYDLLRKTGSTLAAAESCTGGFISYCVTMIPGASSIFRGGVVAYSADLKRDLLGVEAVLIEEKGVVSPEVALRMAEQVRIRCGSDYAIAVTGNLGPDVLEGKDAGLVYIAACGRGDSASGELHLKGSREQNREDAALGALRLLAGLIGRKVES
jgi:PncC family amidohydrolase